MTLEEALAEIERLKNAAKRFEGINPDEIRSDRQSLSTQLENVTRQLNEFKTRAEATEKALREQLTAKDASQLFSKSLGAVGVLPEYADLFGHVLTDLKLEGGKLLNKDGTEFDPKSLVGKYPAMFAAASDGAGSGSNGNNGKPETTTVKTIEAKNGVISGVDPKAIIDGSVVVK